jgi:hypothetical protein
MRNPIAKPTIAAGFFGAALRDGVSSKNTLRFFGVVLGGPGIASPALSKKYFSRERLAPREKRPRKQNEQNGLRI